MTASVNCDSKVDWEAYLLRNPIMKHWEEYRPRGTWELRDVTARPPSNHQLVIFSGLPGSGMFDAQRVLAKRGESCAAREDEALRTPDIMHSIMYEVPVRLAIGRETLEGTPMADLDSIAYQLQHMESFPGAAYRDPSALSLADAPPGEPPADIPMTNFDFIVHHLLHLGRLPGVKYCYSFATSEAFAPHPRTLARDDVRAGYLNELAGLFSEHAVCVVYLRSLWRESWRRLQSGKRDVGDRPDFTEEEYQELAAWLQTKWEYGTVHPHPVIDLAIDNYTYTAIPGIARALGKILQ